MGLKPAAPSVETREVFLPYSNMKVNRMGVYLPQCTAPHFRQTQGLFCDLQTGEGWKNLLNESCQIV